MIKVAHSTNSNPREAADELKAQFGDFVPKFVLCFASTNQEPHELLHRLHHHYREALVAGCSTAREIASGMVLKGGVVAMAL